MGNFLSFTPEPTSSDFHVLTKLKEFLGGKHFGDDDDDVYPVELVAPGGCGGSKTDLG